MPSTTSPNGIPYPNTGDPYNYVGDMANLANGVQTALNNNYTYRTGTSTQRLALTPTEGLMFYETNTRTHWIYTNGAWVVSGAMPLPAPLVTYSTDQNTVTSAAGVWGNVPGASSLTFGTLSRALTVKLEYTCMASTTTSASYAMIGAACSGGLALVPERDPSTSTDRFHFTPFSQSDVYVPLAGSKIVTVPASPTTNFRLQFRRNTATGTQRVNYAKLTVTPIKWA